MGLFVTTISNSNSSKVCCNVGSSWCNEMQARITADDLAKDVSGAEALVSRHKENRTEIDARVKDITRFTQKGKTLIAEKNFMASEVSDSLLLLLLSRPTMNE